MADPTELMIRRGAVGDLINLLAIRRALELSWGMLVLVALHFLYTTPIRASDSSSKLGPMLKMALAADQRAGGTGKMSIGGRPLAVNLKGDPASLSRAVERLGGSVGTVAGDILTAQIPVRALSALTADRALERVEAEPPLQAINDVAREESKADHIHRDEAALGAGYPGSGVVVGIVDSGIDIFHPDFRDPADSTRSRILSIWDQLDDNGPPPPGYRTEHSIPARTSSARSAANRPSLLPTSLATAPT